MSENYRKTGLEGAGMDEKVGTSQHDEQKRKHGFDMEIWWGDRTLAEKILWGIGFAILGIGLLAVLGLVVMLLWNWLMPEIFGLKTLDYWQAWGLLALFTILFKSVGSSNGSGQRTERRRREHLRRYIREEQNPTEE